MVTPLTSIDFFSDMPNGFPGLNILEVNGFKGKSQTTNLKIYRKVLVPGFTTDCLETLEELGEEVRMQFLNNGGKSYRLLPCLNFESTWVHGLGNIIEDLLS
nr:ferrochelatase [Euryarchaeota archaeon]